MARSSSPELAWLLGCASCVACSGGEASVHATLSDPGHPYPSRPADAPVQLFSAMGPECAYVAIGTVTVERGRPLPSRETTLAMAREARRIGGEAIVALGSSGSLLTGTVIRFTDSTCTR